MTSGRPMATASLPSTIQDHATFTAGLAEVIAGVLGEAELAPGSLQIEPTDDQFVLTVADRPALVGLSTASDDDVLLDEISLRLLRRLELWQPDLGPLRGVTRYLAQLGMRSIGPTGTDEPVVVAGERQMDLSPALIVLEVPAGVARRLGDHDIEAMVNLRKDVFHRSGVELPDVQVKLMEPRLRRIRIGLNSTFVTVRAVPADADWGYVVRSLERVLAGRLHWFIRKEQIGRTLDDLWYIVPDLVDSCRLCYPLDVLTACLRELVRHGQSLRNLNRIMWLLLDLGSAESGPDHFLMAETPLPAPRHDVAAASNDPAALATRLRKCVREEEWRVGAPQPPGANRPALA